MMKNKMNQVKIARFFKDFVTRSELFYLIYFVCLSTSKAAGFVEGDIGYRVFLMAGLFFWCLKILSSHNNWREWLVIITLMCLGSIIYLRTKDMGFFICMTMMLGMKNVSVNKVFKLGAIIWSAGITVMTVLSYAGIVKETMRVSSKPIIGEAIRHDFGYSHPNTLGMAVAITVMLIMYCFMQIKNNHIVLLSILLIIWSGGYFLLSYSFTSIFTIIVYLLLNLYFYYREDYSLIECVAIESVFPICLMLALFFPILLFKTDALNEIQPVLRHLGTFYDRMYMTYESFLRYPTLPIGNRMEFSTNISDYFVIDCSYTWLLVQFGWIAATIIIIIFGGLIHQDIKTKNGSELAVILSLLIAGVSEPLLFNTSYKNLIFIFAGVYVYQVINSNRMGLLGKVLRH